MRETPWRHSAFPWTIHWKTDCRDEYFYASKLSSLNFNPSSPGDTTWRTLAPYSGYPHMVSVPSCSESGIPPYSAPYFTTKTTICSLIGWFFIIANNTKKFCKHWLKLLRRRSWIENRNTKLPCEIRPAVCFMQFIRSPAYFLHQLSIIMSADRELVDDISEEELVGFSREELAGFSREELGIHPFGFGGWEVREIHNVTKLLRKLSTKNGQEPWKQRIFPPFQWWHLGLQISSMKIIQSWTFLKFLSRNFGWWEKQTCTLRRKPQWSQIKTKAEYFIDFRVVGSRIKEDKMMNLRGQKL